jgi:hypothetical protein
MVWKVIALHVASDEHSFSASGKLMVVLNGITSLPALNSPDLYV